MKRNKAVKISSYITCIIIGFVLCLSVHPVYVIISSIFWGRQVQVLSSPDDQHKASLHKKYNLADINFIVKVDGQRVYFSPDLINFPDHVYKETLIWDKTGRVVVLELMGKRVFAYDTLEKRELRKGELSQYTLYPMSNDYFYVYLKDIDE